MTPGSRLPPARFFWSIGLLPPQPRTGKPRFALASRPIPATQDPENVQCRAVFIQYHRGLVPGPARWRGRGPTRL